jgi:hypothetical protein
VPGPIKRGFSSLVWHLLPRYLKRHRPRIDTRYALALFFFQKVLGINRGVPWPVHWSSVVPPPSEKFISRASTCPGLMPGVYIQAINGVEIGHNCGVGPGVKILSANHNLEDYNVHDPSDPIVIGDDTWLGANSVILPGVRLGRHVYVAAGAVVTKSFPQDNILLAGVPARIVKELEPLRGGKYRAGMKGPPT